MTPSAVPRLVVVHADESCLGNQYRGASRGGAGALLEARGRPGVVRRDLYLSSPDTTNNRMALSGAIAVLTELGRKPRASRVIYVSDSKYLVDGITSWITGWKRRGWKRKGGPIENLELWRELDRLVTATDVRFEWVRGHAGHPKNEYADHLAVRAAEAQHHSDGFVPSAWDEWLTTQRTAGSYLEYDPDRAFEQIEQRFQPAQSRHDE